MAVESKNAGDRPCPDPSAHSQKQTKLSEQASSAALYVTHPERGTNPRESILSPDGKLSSRSAAASLKHARPQDLPSFPSVGINTANSAGQAAMLAKDYKMKDLWQPELSAAGSKAALLAHKDGGKLDLWHPSASADGNSAAKLAMRNKTLSPQIDYGYTKDGRSNALLAATMSQRDGRRRAGSTPVPALPVYPDSVNSAHNALNAATVSHRASVRQQPAKMEPDGWDSPAMQAARVQNIGDHLSRDMYTEKPPVEIEQQERRDQAALRASAVSMAKQIYEHQHRTVIGDAPPSSSGSDRAHSRGASSMTQGEIKREAMKYIHLQDAAQKLAAERLAKVDKNFENARYREYYGYGTRPQRSRLSIGGRGRGRASSEGGADDLDSDDEEQARRVRSQMLQFHSALASVDSKKQQTDRDNLLAAAQKRVQKSLSDMDERVFQDTGKASQAMMDQWEAKAKKRVADDAEKREANKGKTNIGGGRFMDNAEIEAIALARLKPTLDDINDTAEKRRARDEEIRAEKEEQDMLKREQKQKEKEIKDEFKRIKQEDKAAAKEEKVEAKKEKEERKAVEKEEKPDVPDHHRTSLLSRLTNKRKSRETTKQQAGELAATSAAGATLAEVADKVKDDAEEEPTTLGNADATKSEVAAPLPSTAAVGEPEDDEEDEADEEFTMAPVAATTSEPQDIALPAAAAVPTFVSETKTDDVPAPTGQVKESISPTKPTAADDDTKEKPQKGVRGFFSKLRHRQSRSEPKGPAETVQSDDAAITETGTAAAADSQADKADSEAQPVVAATVSEPPTLPEHVDSAPKGATGNAAPAAAAAPGSPSSFRRHDAGDDADVSSLSSSGLDEHDLREGRTGRMVRKLGIGKSRAEDAPAEPSKKAGAGLPAVAAEKHDEEARDILDPGLAPAPAFAAPKKSASPARETKFQEEF